MTNNSLKFHLSNCEKINFSFFFTLLFSTICLFVTTNKSQQTTSNLVQFQDQINSRVFLQSFKFRFELRVDVKREIDTFPTYILRCAKNIPENLQHK